MGKHSYCSCVHAFLQKPIIIIIENANKNNDFPTKFGRNFHFKNQGFGDFPKKEMSVSAARLIDGYIIKVDYTEQKKLAAAVSRVASNINHVRRRINSTGHFFDADVAELKARMADVWELLKVRQKEEL